MEFWGIEVKPGKIVSCDAGDECVIKISQVALGETKKGSENVVVSVKVEGNKTVIGNLSAERHPQFMCDLVVGKEFELSHSSKTTSVFLCGYKIDMPNPYESDSGEDEDKDEEIPDIHDIMGKHLGRPVAGEDKKDSDFDDGMDLSSSDDDDDESSDEDDKSSDDDGSDESPAELESFSPMETSDEEDGSDGEDESSLSMSFTDEEDESDEEDETSLSMGSTDEEDQSDEEDEIPKKQPESSKMTAAGPTMPASGKKSKIVTPSGKKTGDKNAHVATHHSAKGVGKTPAISKPNEKTPKSSGAHACRSCSKAFGSDAALQSLQKAKHPAK